MANSAAVVLFLNNSDCKNILTHPGCAGVHSWDWKQEGGVVVVEGEEYGRSALW